MACCKGKKISIIIPTWNHLEDGLKPCLESIFEYTDLSDKEIIIVANGCTDGTERYVEGLNMGGEIKLLSYPEPLGYALACNKGIEAASGNYIILLNNDTILLDQPLDQWVQMLYEPFVHQSEHEKPVGLTGPLVTYSDPADAMFVIFFCAMISKKVIDDIGLISLEYGKGGGEDTDYCIRAERAGWRMVEVPMHAEKKQMGENYWIGGFPIYHGGELTVHGIPEWNDILKENSETLTRKYNRKNLLHNNWERAVAGRHGHVPPPETRRYTWAAENIVGKTVMEVGCTCGYGLRFIHKEGMIYTGVDYDPAIIEYAKEQFGDMPGVSFVCSDINKYPLTPKDTIIAFEVLEHLDNGRELAQELKKYCKRLLITTPYDETPGAYGQHHKLHHLLEDDFPGFEWSYIDFSGNIYRPKPTDKQIFLMVGLWDKATSEIKEPAAPKVLCEVCTKGRYHTTLPMTIQSIAMQTKIPDKLLIIDNTAEKDAVKINDLPIYQYLFDLLYSKGCNDIFIVSAPDAGITASRTIALGTACNEGYAYVWRIDDDEIAEPNVLEVLYEKIGGNKIGAVGGAVVDPHNKETCPEDVAVFAEDVLHKPNMQWYRGQDGDVYDVGHLYSSFLYSVEAATKAGGYEQRLSKAGHREETLFTSTMDMKGYTVHFTPQVTTWHLRQPEGGLRQLEKDNGPLMWEHDDLLFKDIMRRRGRKIVDTYYIVLNSGIGDHYDFMAAWPAIKAAHPHEKIVIAVGWPDIVRDDDVEIISIAEAMSRIPNIDIYNIYGWCMRNNWKKSLVEAYKEMYT